VEEKNGFYFLVSRSQILLTRQERHHFSAAKFKLAYRATRLFRIIPFVEMIAVSNIIGSHNLRDESDIDLFIVASPERLWLTRLFCTGLAKILGWRPTAKTKRNRICLSFYISSDALKLESLKLGQDDFYFNYWLVGLVPIYNKNKTYSRLIAENDWLKNYLPNWSGFKLSIDKKDEFKINNPGILSKLERRTMDWQLKIMPPSLKSLINIDTRVRVNNQIIKLYLVDRRREFSEKFSRRLNQILNK
jgi:hypothetical protein